MLDAFLYDPLIFCNIECDVDASNKIKTNSRYDSLLMYLNSVWS